MLTNSAICSAPLASGSALLPYWENTRGDPTSPAAWQTCWPNTSAYTRAHPIRLCSLYTLTATIKCTHNLCLTIPAAPNLHDMAAVQQHTLTQKSTAHRSEEYSQQNPSVGDFEFFEYNLLIILFRICICIILPNPNEKSLQIYPLDP